MILYLIIIILLSLSIIFSMRYLLKTFDKLEMIGLFIFCSSTHQQFFYFFSSMFKFVDMLEQYLPDTIIRIDYTVFSPSLLVWTLCLIVKARSLLVKLLVGALWVVITVLIQQYEINLGLLINNNWKLQHEIIKRLAILGLCYVFMKIWRGALRRDRVIS